MTRNDAHLGGDDRLGGDCGPERIAPACRSRLAAA